MSTLDKTESAAVHLILVLTIAFTFVGWFVAPAFLYVGLIGLFVIWGLSVYWALYLRRLLSAQLYRNQALGEGLVAIAWASLNAANFSVYLVQRNGGFSFILSVFDLLVFALAIALAFYWIDSSALAARKSDPLYRDALHWRKVRLVIWPLVVGSVLLLWVLGVAATSLLIRGNVVTGSPTLLFLGLFLTPLICTFGLGLPLLLLSGRRSRDQTLRRNLEWFALLAASALVFFGLGYVTSGALSTFLSGSSLSMIFISFSYCIYRSVKSLAPLNRLPGDAIKTAQGGTQ